MISYVFAPTIRSYSKFDGRDVCISHTRLREVLHPSQVKEVIWSVINLPDVRISDAGIIIPAKYIGQIGRDAK